MKHVLLVDDSVETRDLVQIVFTSIEDLHIDYAASSEEAIDMFNSNTYSACVLDVSLPDITGYYLGKLIRKVCEDMPIAFLTNYETSSTKNNAQAIDAEFWTKSEVFSAPLQLVELIRNIAGDVDCEPTGKIEKPELMKQVT